MRNEHPGAVSRLPISPLALLVLAAALCAAVVSAADNPQDRGLALIARAGQLHDLLAPDTGPFRLRVSVRLLGLVNGTREGQYLLMVASPARWFDSARFPGYSETTGLSNGERWRKRNVIDKPYRFHEATRMLDVAGHLRFPADARVRTLVQKDAGGRPVTCAEVTPTADLWQKDTVGRAAISEVARAKDSSANLCFDGASGMLVSASYGGELPRFEYEGVVTLGAKAYPKTMRCYEGKELAAEASVDELVAQQGAETEESYATPAGAQKWPDCRVVEPPKLIAKKSAEENTSARAHRQYGTVLALAEVGTDGLIHDLAFVQYRGGLFDTVKQAVTSWRYQPATCNGVPVPVQFYLAYTFTP